MFDSTNRRRVGRNRPAGGMNKDIRQRQGRSSLRLEHLEDRTLPTSGVPDPTFGTAGLIFADNTGARIRNFAVQADGKIIAVGSAAAGNASDFFLTRYNSDGSLDSSFGQNG